MRSSPQRREAWLEDANAYLQKLATTNNIVLEHSATMLILDVRTRWSSTHQMLHIIGTYRMSLLLLILLSGRAIDYRTVIDDFVAKNREIRKHELQDEDWDAIEIVALWLKSFRSATTQMSTTKQPMLSWIHAIFRGLEDSLAANLRSLPNNIPSLRRGLLKAHRKLSDYYGKSDESPYYTWASRSSSIPLCYFTLILMNCPPAVLDPRISYSGLLADCGDDLDSHAHLESAKDQLHTRFHAKYEKPLPVPTATPIVSSSTTSGSPQKVDFISRYRNLPQVKTDEVEEYFKLPRENFDTCDPLRWWAGRCSQFPGLSRFARDILSIPGKPLMFSCHLLASHHCCRVCRCCRTYFFRKP